jgi:predicted CXXCH cytochrome family protein
MRQRTTGRPPPPKATARPGPPPIVSTHKPVADHQCRMCHQSNRGYYEPIGVDEQLCDRCHKDLRLSQGWNHGPINLGTCLPCHRAHESPYPHLMDRPLPELCLLCHAEDVDRTPKYHQVPNLNQCTACHDPHRTGVLKEQKEPTDRKDANITGLENDRIASGSGSQL